MNNLLKELEKERDVALKHQHNNDHSWGYLNGIEKAIEIVKNCSIPAVVGQSEQLPTDIEIGKMVSDLANIANDEKER